jgi:DNA-binding transcriptional ArsR family regulator
MAPTAVKHDVFMAISDPTRRELLRLLSNQEKPVVSIRQHFPISRTAVNKHLSILLAAGLVTNQKIGRENRYRAQLEPLNEVKEWLDYVEHFWDSKVTTLKNYVEDDNRIK